MRSTSKSTSCPSLQREQNKWIKRNSYSEDWERERVAELRAKDAEENGLNNSRTRARFGDGQRLYL